MSDDTDPTTKLAVDLVAAYVSNNHIQPEGFLALIAKTHAVLTNLPGAGAPQASPPVEKPTPAQIRKSITPEALISFEDGKPYTILRRHLTLRGLTPEAYRAKWGLPVDYPLVAAAYSAARSKLAHDIGLGVPRRQQEAVEPAPAGDAPAQPRKGRRKAGELPAGE